MDNKQYVLYLLLMAGSTYLIRAIPFSLIKKRIENQFIRSFLHYIPYAVLTAMTFPAVLYATNGMLSAAIGLCVAILFSLWGKSLTTVAVAACSAVFLVELAVNPPEALLHFLHDVCCQSQYLHNVFLSC